MICKNCKTEITSENKTKAYASLCKSCHASFKRAEYQMNKYKKFIDWLKKMQEERGKDAYLDPDELFNFLEDNDLMIDFIECKFNWLGLYAYSKYKVEKKSLAWLKRAILQAVNPNTHNL